jgi:hypothetical protein
MAHVTDLQGAYNLVTGFPHRYIILSVLRYVAINYGGTKSKELSSL